MQSKLLLPFAACAAFAAATAPATAGPAPARHGTPAARAHRNATGGSIWLSVYVTGEGAEGHVSVYPLVGQNQQPSGGLTSPNCNSNSCPVPLGLAADANGDLYAAFSVTNVPGPIAMYQPGMVAPSSLLGDSWGAPFNLTFGANGSLYAESAANVYRYGPKQTQPNANFFDPSAQQLEGLAVDRKGTVYVSYEKRSGTSSIALFSGGKNVPVETSINLGSYNFYAAAIPPDIALDSAGNILAAAVPGGITAYSATAPFATLGAIGVSGSPEVFAFDSTGTELFVADGATGAVTEYAYDDTTNPAQPHVTGVINTLSTSYPLVTGLAVYPGLIAPL